MSRWDITGKNIMATARCKWCGKEMPVEVLLKFGGYCCPAHYQAGLQRQR